MDARANSRRSGTARIRPQGAETASERTAERTGSGVSPRRNALPNALDPGFHRVGTHWIRGFMAFHLARHTRTVMLMVPV